MAPKQFEYVDEQTLRTADGERYDVLAAVAQLPWTRQWCPFMPHEYAILSKSPEHAWHVVEAMIKLSPKSYKAFFQGYQSANRYWEAPDGKRYWRSAFELDRWDASNTHGLRRKDEAAHAIKGWDGPRWAPNGAGYYLPGPEGKWWPGPKFFGEGYVACLACRKPPADILAVVGADHYKVVDPASLNGEP